MSIGSPSTLRLHDDLPEGVLDPEWHALVSQQARMLAEMLQRIQTAMTRSHQPLNALRLQAIATEAERFFAAQAQQHVRLERELVQLRALVTDLSPAPAALTQRVHRLERVIAVLHTNLVTARQYLTATFQGEE